MSYRIIMSCSRDIRYSKYIIRLFGVRIRRYFFVFWIQRTKLWIFQPHSKFFQWFPNKFSAELYNIFLELCTKWILKSAAGENFEDLSTLWVNLTWLFDFLHDFKLLCSSDFIDFSRIGKFQDFFFEFSHSQNSKFFSLNFSELKV